MNEMQLIAVVFGSTVVFILGLAYFLRALFGSESLTVQERFKEMHASTQARLSQDQTLALLKQESEWNKEEMFSDFPPFLNLPLLFEQAGKKQDVVRWLSLRSVLASVLGMGVWLGTQRFLLGISVLGLVLLFSYLSVIRARKKRIRQFEAGLYQALEVLTRSLRAGHPFSMGVYMISTELPSPIKDEFGRVFQEQRVGIPIEEALKQMVKRVPLIDLRFFVLSIMIHSQTGGDLAEILDNLSKVIRERFKILGQVRALTAEGRLSGWVLSALPFLVFFLLTLLNPEYIFLLIRTELGRSMLYGAICMQIIGIFFIRKIVNIKV